MEDSRSTALKHLLIPILSGLFFQTLDKHLQFGFGESTEKLIGGVIVEIDHETITSKGCSTAASTADLLTVSLLCC
jgi:hypothetical protein